MMPENKHFMTAKLKPANPRSTDSAQVKYSTKAASHVTGFLASDTIMKYLEKYKMDSDFPEVSWRKLQVALKSKSQLLTLSPSVKIHCITHVLWGNPYLTGVWFTANIGACLLSVRKANSLHCFRINNHSTVRWDLPYLSSLLCFA